MLFQQIKNGKVAVVDHPMLEEKQNAGELRQFRRVMDECPLFQIPELAEGERRGFEDTERFADLLAAMAPYQKPGISLRAPYAETLFETTAYMRVVIHKGEPYSRHRVLVIVADVPAADVPKLWVDDFPIAEAEGNRVLILAPFIEITFEHVPDIATPKVIVPAGGFMVMVLDKEGGMLAGGNRIRINPEQWGSHHANVPKEFGERWISEIITLACLPVVRGLALLNCKNVETETHRFEVPGRKGKKKYHGPLAKRRYHTLKLVIPGRAGKSVSVGATTHSEAARAEHLVRGHFADYRQGPGLFGRVNGVFWIPAHVRGSKEAGVIEKDYSIEYKQSA